MAVKTYIQGARHALSFHLRLKGAELAQMCFVIPFSWTLLWTEIRKQHSCFCFYLECCKFFIVWGLLSDIERSLDSFVSTVGNFFLCVLFSQWASVQIYSAHMYSHTLFPVRRTAARWQSLQHTAPLWLGHHEMSSMRDRERELK